MAALTRHLTGVVALSDSVAQSLAALIGLDARTPLRDLQLTPDGANTAAAFVGADDTLTADNWGSYLPAGDDGEPPAPYIRDGYEDGTVLLGEFWVLGAAADLLLHYDIVVFAYRT